LVEYITIFEIPRTWTNYFIVLCVICSIIGLSLAAILFIYALKNWKNWQTEKTLRKEIVFLFFFFLVWGLVWSFGAYGVYNNIRLGNEIIEAYYSGKYEIIEGTVKVLHQQPKSGHDSGDLIRINQKEIEFSYFTSTPAYHQTLSQGGVLKDGVYVRLYLYKGNILRIDVSKTEENLNHGKGTGNN